MTTFAKRKFSIGLKYILLAVGVGILLFSAVIAFHFLGQAQRVKQLAEFEAGELARYEIALKAFGAISSEKVPSDTAMTRDGPAILDALRQTRAETDARLAELRQAYPAELKSGGVYFGDFALLQAHLRSARHSVDKIASQSLDRRHHEQVDATVSALIASSNAALALRDKLGAKITADTQLITGDILMLNQASALRETTGRLGSQVVHLLSHSDNEAEARAAIAALRVELERDWNDLRQYAPAHFKMAEVNAAVDVANQRYFLGSLPYLSDVLRRHDSGEKISAKTFADRYSRGLTATEDLRKAILRATLKTAEKCLRDASNSLLAGTVSFGMICILLLGFALATARLLFAPLLCVREAIFALATGDLETCQRATRASSELEEVYDGIAVLRQLLIDKKEAEREQLRLLETLRSLSERDPLTQLYNRRVVDDLATDRMREADTDNSPLGVLIVDLDHFKRINDAYGHAVGDLVLKATADQMRRTLRATDVVARFGGEEFLIILDDCDEEQAKAIANQLRSSIAAMDIDDDLAISVTASIGLCVRMPGTAMAWNDIVVTADRRLYRAKSQGRNRVCAQEAAVPAPEAGTSSTSRSPRLEAAK